MSTNLVATNATTTNLVVTGSASQPTTTVSGDLSVSGTLSAGSLSVAGISSGGAIAAPYFTATSSTATSTFAGAVGTIRAFGGNNLTSGENIADTFQVRSFSNSAGGLVLAAGGANSARLFTNSSERMTVASAGFVGIGTTSPYAKLSVTNTGYGPSFIVEDSTSPDTPFVIDASGNAGVGSASRDKQSYMSDLRLARMAMFTLAPQMPDSATADAALTLRGSRKR